MKAILTALILTSLVSSAADALAQTDIPAENKHKLDSVQSLLKPTCNEIGSSQVITEKQIAFDKKALSICNDLYFNDLSKAAIEKKISKALKNKFYVDSTNLGGTTLYQLTIRAKGNLNIVFSFAIFSNEVVYKHISFRTISRTNCFVPKKYFVAPNDLVYFEKTCLPILKIPLKICWTCESITSDTTMYDKLKDYKGDKYVVFTDDTTKYLNYLTWHEVDKYMTDYVVDQMKPIVQQRNIPLLQQLVFSPNHLLALYSMEALSFFKITENIELPSLIQSKMSDVTNSLIPINFQHSDVEVRGLLYKDLHISEKQLINKFSKLLQ